MYSGAESISTKHRHYKKVVLQIVAAYFVMVTGFLLFSISACHIPHKYIDNNLKKSMEQLNEEGRFPLTCGLLIWGKDNITDGTMYNILVSGYDMTPFEEFIANPWSCPSDIETNTAHYGLLTMRTRDGSIERQSYGRYWHGYQVPLRISSMFFTIKGQRIFHSIILWSLFFLLTYLTYKRLGKIVAAGWFVIVLAMGFPAVPLSLQFIACYYILFCALLLMLWHNKLSNSMTFFFIIGGVTSYMDYLTVPLITLCIPLIFALLIDRKGKSNRFLILAAAAWFAGYSSIWATKWIIQYVFMGSETLSTVINAGEAHTIIPFLPDGLTHKYFKITCATILLSLVTTTAVYFIKRRKNSTIKQLYFISLIPIAWYIIFLGHNVCHIWFTYRSLTTTLLCIWIMIFSNKIAKENENSSFNPLLQ